MGTSFGEHVMAGYKFLMRYYTDGDAIYFFGFSRGAYTARFLAQMLDYVGLLTAGNEEMLRFGQCLSLEGLKLLLTSITYSLENILSLVRFSIRIKRRPPC